MKVSLMENSDKNILNNNEEGISLSQLFTVISRRFRLILLCLIIAVGLGAYYLYVTVPIFESTSTAMITPITNSSSIESMLTGGSNSSKISTEVNLITSLKNLEEALNSLDLTLYIDSEGVPYSQKKITASGLKRNVSVSTFNDTNMVSVTVKNENPQFAADYANSILSEFSKLLTSIAKNSKTTQRLFLESQIPINEDNLKESTYVLTKFKEESGITQMTSNNAVLAERLSFFQLKKEPLKIQEKECIDLVSSYYEALKENNEISDIEDFKENSDINKILLNQQVWKKELLMYASMENLAISDKQENIPTSSDRVYVLENSISSSKKELLDKIKTILQNEVSNNDLYTQLQINNYSQALVKALSVVIEIAAIEEVESGYQTELDKYPVLERELIEKEGDVKVYQALALSLRQMLEDTKLVESAISGYVTIIDMARVPYTPVSPNKMLILCISILLGFCFGVLFALIRDWKDVVISNIDTVKRVLPSTIPCLGWFLLLDFGKVGKSDYSLVSLEYPTSFVSERYNFTISNILFSSADEIKVIGVNSSGIGEGKSSMVCNLGVSFSRQNKKVLIIDGDLRHPTIENYFKNKKAKYGIVDYIVAKRPLEGCIIRALGDNENLDILPVGHTTRKPAIIFNSKSFDTLMKDLRTKYDIILIDSPPFSIASEFAAIQKYCDGIVINVRAGITTTTALSTLYESLTLIGTKILGFLYNGVIYSSSEGYNYFGRYSYGYKDQGYYGSEKGYKKSKQGEDFLASSKGRLSRKYNKIYKRELGERENAFSSLALKEPIYLKDLQAFKSSKLNSAFSKTDEIFDGFEIEEVEKPEETTEKKVESGYKDILDEIENDPNSVGKIKD